MDRVLWFCHRCRTKGIVEYEGGERGLIDSFTPAKDHHDQASPLCPDRESLFQRSLHIRQIGEIQDEDRNTIADYRHAGIFTAFRRR